jgi:hypothetical protein
MKKNVLVFFMLLGSVTLVFGQDKEDKNPQEYSTLFKQDAKTRVSGFGGLTMEFSGVNKSFGYSMGGVGAVLFNQSFFFGGYGMGLVNVPKYVYPEPKFQNENENIIFGHGGFYLGYIFRPNKPFHFGVSSKIGWGMIQLFEKDYNYNGGAPIYPPYYDEYMYDNVFVITPQVEGELNIANWFKFNFGLGYRITTGIDATYEAYNSNGLPIGQTPYFDSNAFDSVTFSLGLYFGWFK